MNRATRCADTAQIKKALSRVDLDYDLYTLLKAAKKKRLGEHREGAHSYLVNNGYIKRAGFGLTCYGQRLLRVAELLIAHEEAEAAKKLETKPLAKLLVFNLKGHAIEDIDFRDDCAYLAKKGFSFPASSAHLVPHMQQMDWMKENLSKTDEELQKAYNDLWDSPNRPRWMDRVKAEQMKAAQESQNKPTPPAA